MTTLLRVCLVALGAVVLASAPAAGEPAPKVDVDLLADNGLLACGPAPEYAPTTAFAAYLQGGVFSGSATSRREACTLAEEGAYSRIRVECENNRGTVGSC